MAQSRDQRDAEERLRQTIRELDKGDGVSVNMGVGKRTTLPVSSQLFQNERGGARITDRCRCPAGHSGSMRENFQRLGHRSVNNAFFVPAVNFIWLFNANEQVGV